MIGGLHVQAICEVAERILKEKKLKEEQETAASQSADSVNEPAPLDTTAAAAAVGKQGAASTYNVNPDFSLNALNEFEAPPGATMEGSGAPLTKA